jgi:hypothetical protein
VRLRVTCDFGLWRRRGEEKSKHIVLNHFGRGEVSTIVIGLPEASSIQQVHDVAVVRPLL